MKKSILVIMLACLLMTGLLIACSPKATAPTATATTQPTTVVNIPIVAQPAATQPAATQPAASNSYTLDELKAMTDQQVRTFFDQRIQGHHTIDWVLKKSFSVAEWKSILGAPQHSDLVLSVIERDFLIDWIIKNHQP